jgi:hypothetical protein
MELSYVSLESQNWYESLWMLIKKETSLKSV